MQADSNFDTESQNSFVWDCGEDTLGIFIKLRYRFESYYYRKPKQSTWFLSSSFVSYPIIASL